jgi:hypothetical protein
MEKNVFVRLVVLTIFAFMILTSASQGIVNQDITIDKSNFRKFKSNPLGEDPFFTWEDDFDTTQWIDPDPTLSFNYELANVGGDTVALMKNTYDLWTDPDWTKMKQITITSSSPLADYAVLISIEYDSDMQTDYDDLRFKHEENPSVWCDYWIESGDSNGAIIWVKIDYIPTGDSTLCMFYGNPSASGMSNFYDVFTEWEEYWANDERVTEHYPKEGSWDPDVCFGNDEFLVIWEEGQYYIPPLTTGFKQELRASIYDPDGDILVDDELVYKPGTTYYRNENPSIAYGGNGKFFVAWEHYENTANPSITTMDIYGRTVMRNGAGLSLGSVRSICIEDNCQADPNVEFDSINEQYLVVWEDARSSTNDYNIYARLYDSDGAPVASEVTICDEGNTQCEPWVAFDSINEQYMIVWEEGLTPEDGPFRIMGGLYDADTLNELWSGTVAEPSGWPNYDLDYNFPCVEFCEETEVFMVTWNDCDVSDDDWKGNVYGKIVDTSGDTVVDSFTIKNGNYIRTDIVPYLTTHFFVSYDNSDQIWGKLVSSDGFVLDDDIRLSASTSADADWANMAVGAGKIFVSWEDTRAEYDFPWDDNPDVYANIWNLNIPSGGDVSYSTGVEKDLILDAQITSKEIPEDSVIEWAEFNVLYDISQGGSLIFNVLDSTATNVLIADINDGEDLSSINAEDHPQIRLQAQFDRSNPSFTPLLDYWSVTYVGVDENPPVTTIDEIVGTLGQNGWYTSNVKIYLDATDGQYGTGVNHTYYRVDDGDVQIYDDNTGINLPDGDPYALCGVDNVYYWSVDKAGNQEDQNGPELVKIDKGPPHCRIWDPPDRAKVPMEGGFWVQVDAEDNCSEIWYIRFDVGPPYENPVLVYEDDPPGSGNYRWYCDRSTSVPEWRHLIAVAVDYAGHEYEYNIYIQFPRSYTSGILRFLSSLPVLRSIKFDTPIDVEELNFGIVANEALEVETSGQVDSAKFAATRLIGRKETVIWDYDSSDGLSASFNLPTGFYKLITTTYRDNIELTSNQGKIFYIRI